MSHRTGNFTPGLTERVISHLYRTLPPGHAIDLELATVLTAVGKLADASRKDLSVLPIEDEDGLAAVALVKERRSELTGGREGFLYCLIPCRSNPSITASATRFLHRLTKQRGWAALRVSLFTADAPGLASLLDATNLRLGWIVSRKILHAIPSADSALPGTTRPVRREDLNFVCASWREAYLAGLQEEASWQTRQSAELAADMELAELLGSEHCALLAIESDRELVGFVAAEIGKPESLTGRRECHLYDCYVSPRYRGQGYSQRGTKSLERLAWNRGCRYMTGTVTGAGAPQIEAILGKIGQDGWVPYQSIYRCRGPLARSQTQR